MQKILIHKFLIFHFKFCIYIMSRIGKKPIEIPDNVEVKVDKDFVVVKGPKGKLKQEIRPEIKVKIKDKKIQVSIAQKTKKSSGFWGLTRTLIANMIQGVLEGYEKKLEIVGVGFKAEMQGKKIVFQLGFSHAVDFFVPKEIEVKIEKNIITVSGIDKQLVGKTTAEIRALKKPEPYKGKGIRYFGEHVKIKPGKKAAGAETGPGAA